MVTEGLPPLPSPPPPCHLRVLLQHSLRIQGTAHVAVTGAATKQVMAQTPVARLGKRDCWRPETDLSATHQQASTLIGEYVLGLPDQRPLIQDETLSSQYPPTGLYPQSYALRTSPGPGTPNPSVVPGSGHSHVQSPDACRNRFHCWSHKGCPQALYPVNYTDNLQWKRPISTVGSRAVLRG